MSAFHFSPRPNRAAEIHWREWSEAPFAQAERDEKPVLLAISAVWCHWCHVMDETTYSSPAVISLINDRFVPIRVDNDRRPDINARYNMGGWPTTALLTPHGEILKGGTYIPPDAMISLLDQIAQLYAEPDVRSSIARRAAEIKDRRTDASVRPEPSALDADTVPLVEEALWQSFDSDYGGFGTEPKFPQVEVLHFLLDLCARSQDDRAQTMLCKTLRAMADGGMYDHVEGGFFRYSTTRDYSVPHFEKMLEDLSGLLLACAKAAALFGDGALAKIAVDTKGYMDRRLWNDAFGAYGGSQDADEEYYALDEGARRNAKVPFVDSTVYASWNAAAARALILSEPLLAGCGADVRGWTERGLEVLETLWSKLMSDGLMCRYFDGASGVRGLLGDQAWSIWAALSAFSVTGTLTWLHRTGELIAAAEVLYSGDAQGYLDRPPAPDDPGRVGEPAILVDENAVMARALMAYAAYSGEQRWAARARAILGRTASKYRGLGTFAAGYAAAVLEAQSPPLEVNIVGRRGMPAVRAMRAAAAGVAKPALRINTIDPVAEPQRLRMAGYTDEPSAAAYVCREGECFARAVDAETLRAVLRDVGAAPERGRDLAADPLSLM